MHTVPRYLPTYRQSELQAICDYARRGESLCLMGIAGTGKSNLVQILRGGRDFIARYLGAETDRVHFDIVDATVWQGTPLHLWQLMLEGIQTAVALFPAPPAATIVPLSEEDRVRRRLQTHIDWICQTQQQQVMFVLDDFDPVLSAGPLSMLEQLNAFRSAQNRDQLSYLLFTKRLPHVLARQFDLAGRSKFYDLLRRNVFALGVYHPDDARQMLRHLNTQAGSPLSLGDLAQIQHLSGGHSSLQHTIFKTWAKAPPERSDLVTHFVRQPDIRLECARIWRGLHEQEQLAGARLAQGLDRPDDAPTLDHLARRGVLNGSPPYRWFSPVLPVYLQSLPLLREA